jgi:Cu+-exporting ATPase
VTDVVPWGKVESAFASRSTPDGQLTPDRLLQIAASAERGSEHPLGEAVVNAAMQRGLALQPAHQFNAIAGQGVEATVDGHVVLLGTPGLLQQRGVPLNGLAQTVARLQAEAKTAMFVAVDGAAAGVIAVADVIRPESQEAVQQLQRAGLTLVMLTGDNQETAQAIARQVGIDRVIADVRPEQKAERVQSLQASLGRDGRVKTVVAMVGDGINDAPALALADVGIAIGTGTDVAMAAADVTLISPDLRGVLRAIRVSQTTVRTIKQNLFWAFFYNVLLIPVAAGILRLAFGGPILDPILAAGAMALSSVSVVANSLRLRNTRIA